MSPLLSSILSGMIVAVISVLLTNTIMISLNRRVQDKYLLEKVTGALDIHNKIEHKESMYTIIRNHIDECEARKNMPEIKDTVLILKVAMTFLVKQAGGNPEDLGL